MIDATSGGALVDKIPEAAKQLMSLEDIFKNIANGTIKFQQETRDDMQNLENQITQLFT